MFKWNEVFSLINDRLIRAPYCLHNGTSFSDSAEIWVVDSMGHPFDGVHLKHLSIFPSVWQQNA